MNQQDYIYCFDCSVLSLGHLTCSTGESRKVVGTPHPGTGVFSTLLAFSDRSFFYKQVPHARVTLPAHSARDTTFRCSSNAGVHII